MYSRFISTLIEYRSLFRVSLAYTTIMLALAFLTEAPIQKLRVGTYFYFDKFFDHLVNYILIYMVFAVALVLIRHIRERKISKLTAAERLNTFFEKYITVRLIRGFAIFLCMFGMLFFFIGKSFVTRYGDLFADPMLFEVEKLLHFGHLPTDLIPQSWYSSLTIQYTSYAYMAWFWLQFAFIFYALFIEHSKALTAQVVWTYLLSWIILGTVLANLLSSGGPLFLDANYPQLAASYDPIMSKLLQFKDGDGAGSFYLFLAKNSLEQSYLAKEPIASFSISAMPSMHVALAWANFLQARRMHWSIGIVTFIYAAWILFGSVFLLWHYAIDGYVSIIGVSLIWIIAGKCMRRKYKDQQDLQPLTLTPPSP